MAQERNCPICNTVNEADYIYCKNCGTQLPPVAAAQPAPQPPVTYTPPVQPQEEQPAPAQAANQPADTVCGVALPEANAFIGANADTFIPKFKKMEQGASSGWNWPVFLFSFLLNIPFVWFFYRKMYKVGAWVLAVSAVFTFITAACTSGMMSTVFAPIFEFITQNIELFNAYTESANAFANPALGAFEQELINIATNALLSAIGYILVLSFIGLLQLVFTILLSVFANKLYYNHCAKKLQALRRQYNGMIPPAPLRVAGGTSTGAAVAVGIIAPMVFSVIQSLPALQLFGSILQMVSQNMHF